MKRRFLLVIMTLMVTYITYSFNIRIAPTGFGEDINKPISREVFIYNQTDEPMRVVAQLEDDPIYEKYSLKDYIKIFPKTLSIPPKGKKAARFRITPTEDMPDGEYKAYLVFQELATQRTREEIEKANLEANGEVKMEIKMLTNMGISIYGYKGEIIPKVVVHGDTYSQESKIVVVDGETLGNCAVTVIGDFKYYDSNENELGEETANAVIYRDRRDKVSMKLSDIPDGATEVRVRYKTKSDEVLKESVYKL